MKENIRFWSKYRVVTPLFWSSVEMKPCYEGLKEIRVDVNEIWRKMLCFRVSIGLLPLILIVLWNKTVLWRFDEIRADVDERCLDPSSAPVPHLYITNHLTSLTSFKTMFNIVYELASFKTMFNIVYELASFKTIICSRGGWW